MEGGRLERKLSLMEWVNKPEEVDPCVYTISNMTEVYITIIYKYYKGKFGVVLDV